MSLAVRSSTVDWAADSVADDDSVPATMPVAAWFSSAATRSDAASSAFFSGPVSSASWSDCAWTMLVAATSREMSLWKICSTSGSATTNPMIAAMMTRGSRGR